MVKSNLKINIYFLIKIRNTELLEKAKPGIVIALCGNKVDLDERQVSFEVKAFLNQEATKYANEIGSFYIEVSAKMNLNIEKLFDEIANRLPKVQIKNENLKLIDYPTPVDDKCRC